MKRLFALLYLTFTCLMALGRQGDHVNTDTYVRSAVDRILAAVRNKEYAAVQDLFTSDGLDMYNRLIACGNAEISGDPDYSIFRDHGRLAVRSVPMAFSFEKGDRSAFFEDVVLTFNGSGKIESLTFGLDEEVTLMNILSRRPWPRHCKVALLEFLEDFRTTCSLQRLDHLRSLFDDDAIFFLQDDRNVKFIPRVGKDEYMRRIERCFSSSGFTYIRLSDIDILKRGNEGEVYGIQMKMDCCSENHVDTGYLFLLYDINHTDIPSIKAASWQSEPDPDEGLFNNSHL